MSFHINYSIKMDDFIYNTVVLCINIINYYYYIITNDYYSITKIITTFIIIYLLF